MQSQFETVIFARSGAVATITLNRPEAFNALNATMARELQDIFQTIGRDDGVRSVILTGAGRAFCSGQDLKAVEPGTPDVGRAVREILLLHYGPLVQMMRALPKPIVGAINGVAAGAGMSLALATDLRVAADTSSFMQAFSRVGLMPDAGSNYLLPRIVGLGRALDLAWSARRVGADEALSMGLVNSVVAADRLMEEAGALAERLAQGPALAMACTKQAMIRGTEATLQETMALEAELQARCAADPDFLEGVRAFLEKRDPRFGQAAPPTASPVPAAPEDSAG